MSDEHSWYPPEETGRGGRGQAPRARDRWFPEYSTTEQRSDDQWPGDRQTGAPRRDPAARPQNSRELPKQAGRAQYPEETLVGGRAEPGYPRRDAVWRPLDGTLNAGIDLDELDPTGRVGRPGRPPGRPPGHPDRPTRPGGRPSTPAGRSLTRRRRILRWASMTLCTVLVVALGVAAYLVQTLSGNIKHQALLQPGETQSAEPVDGFGNSPMNILIIGSDTRGTAVDCALGGDCGAGANADVEMVVHLSADRSNATIMSIPRDTMITMPGCVDTADNTSTAGGEQAQITTSLQWGPSCTQKAVHNLTGLTIDHYVMVDFSGVEALSDALGGVKVCVSDTMYDRNSGLRLNAGENTVEGRTALEFVRTRHGFYDGSDLGREKAQHYFLAAMIREVRQTMNLSDAGTLLAVANASTNALTVDDGLSGLTNLMALATTMNRVPTNRISFVTMPWYLDPTNLNRVMENQPYAGEMFRNIARDVPYSSAKGRPAAQSTGQAAASPDFSSTESPTVSPTGAAVDDSLVRVQVRNGSGITGRAAAVATALTTGGFRQAAVDGNATATAATTLYYPVGRADSAAAVADALGLPAMAVAESSAYPVVTLVIGSDWPSGDMYSGAMYSGAMYPGGPSPTAAAGAPAVSSLENAATTGGCVPVDPPDVVRPDVVRHGAMGR